MTDNKKNELNKRELNMDELEMVTGGTEDEGESIGVHNYFNDSNLCIKLLWYWAIIDCYTYTIIANLFLHFDAHYQRKKISS